jgi:hypothetical protein
LKKGFINDSLWFSSIEFSSVVHNYEIKGVNLVVDCIDFIKFQQSIEKMELIDVPMVGENVSWYMFDGFVMN